MHEHHLRVRLRELFEREARLGGAVCSRFEAVEGVRELEVAEVEGAFFATGEDGDDAGRAGGGEGGEELGEEAQARVVAESVRDVEAFRGGVSAGEGEVAGGHEAGGVSILGFGMFEGGWWVGGFGVGEGEVQEVEMLLFRLEVLAHAVHLLH